MMREKDLKENGLADMAYKVEKDHEVQMARGDLYKIAKYGIKLHEMLKGVSEEQGLEGWVQAKITKAADYLGSVYHHLDYETQFEQVSESRKKESVNLINPQKKPEPKNTNTGKMDVTDADKKMNTPAYQRMKAGDKRYNDKTTPEKKEESYVDYLQSKLDEAKGLCSDCGNPSYTTLPEEKQKGVDGKVCWKGYKRMGTKKKGGKTVDNCVKM